MNDGVLLKSGDTKLQIAVLLFWVTLGDTQLPSVTINIGKNVRVLPSNTPKYRTNARLSRQRPRVRVPSLPPQKINELNRL